MLLWVGPFDLNLDRGQPAGGGGSYDLDRGQPVGGHLTLT